MLLEVLQQRKLPEIFEVISRYHGHLLINPLFIALCNPDDKVRFHAVRCFGHIVSTMAENEPEAARIVMRRFLWSLNDESGGIGWGAPEAMAEIMCHSELLRKEYLHMLISYMREDGDEPFQDGNYIELPMLQRGVVWGIGRLAQCHPAEMIAGDVAGDVAAYLDSPDRQVAGLAIWSLGLLGCGPHAGKIKAFLGNDAEITLFRDDVLYTQTLGQLAKEALQSLGGKSRISSTI